MDKFSQAFEADTGKILNIVINSLYSDRDIFLRELLSNASDAIQKRRFMGQTIPDLLNPNDDQIEIIVDKKKNTWIFSQDFFIASFKNDWSDREAKKVDFLKKLMKIYKNTRNQF